MGIENLCERCGKPEKGYSVSEVNTKLKRVAKGPAGRKVESFLCSRCIKQLVDKIEEEEERVPETSKVRRNMVRERFMRSVRPSNR